MDAATVNVFLTALSAMSKVFLVSLAGVLGAYFPRDSPLIPASVMRPVSRFTNVIFLPALVFSSLAARVSVGLLADLGVLLLVCVVVTACSVLAAKLVQCFFQDDKLLFRAAAIAITAPNAVNLPLIIMGNICSEDNVNEEFDGDADLCAEEANTMVFVYSIAWNLVFWGLMYPRLEAIADVRKAAGGEKPGRRLFFVHFDVNELKRIFLQPSMIAIVCGIAVGLITPLKKLLFVTPSVLTPFAGAAIILGEPVVGVQTVIMAASLAHMNTGKGSKDSNGSNGSNGSKGGAAATGAPPLPSPPPPPLAANAVGSHHLTPTRNVDNEMKENGLELTVISKPVTLGANGSCDESEDGDEEDDEELQYSFSFHNGVVQPSKRRETAVGRRSVVTAEEWLASLGAGPVKKRSIAVFIFARLILVPVMVLPIVLLMTRAGLIQKEARLLQLSALIQAGVPSAQQVIVSLTHLGLQSLSARVAYLYLFQYIASVVTLTVLFTVTIAILY